MYDETKATYFSDIREKKITGHSASKKVTKKHGCKLPSDYLSRKEKQQMNGEVITMNPNEVMSWDAFKAMPIDLQQSYLDHLQTEYRASGTDLSKMFGLCKNSLYAYARKHGLKLSPVNASQKTPAYRAKWQAFLNGEKADSSTEPEQPIDIPAEESTPVEPPVEPEKPSEKPKEEERVWMPVTYKHFKLWNVEKQRKYLLNAGKFGYSFEDIAKHFGIDLKALRYYMNMVGLGDLMAAVEDTPEVEETAEKYAEEPQKRFYNSQEVFEKELEPALLAIVKRYETLENRSETDEKPAKKKLAPGSMSINFDHVTSWEALFETLKGIPIDNSVGIRVELWKEGM